MFNRLRKYQLKMNPRKCAFGVTSGKFLGFIVRHRGIEIDQSKIEAIQKMPKPKNLQELRGLQGKLAYIRRFISKLAGRCQPFNRLMKKVAHFEWDEASIKGQVLASFLADHPVSSDWVFSDDFLDEDMFYIEVMLPWMMFFDGAARQEGAGAGVVFISPQRQILLYSFSSSKLCSNNVAEYQALIIGLQMAIEIGISQLEIFRDSKLIINQILEQYNVKKEDLVPYCKYAKKLLANLEGLDAIGPLPKSSGVHLYILAATDYFSKWAKAVPLREVKKEMVVNFIRTPLIYRYGVPWYIVIDNGKPFHNRLITVQLLYVQCPSEWISRSF
ncbi:uncharacterized protein LOC142634613 [Castanea sativa]|uniref:uncharacterized protein LOC142634613 n=1 Tax=Castanea sativa TaxID=21020 RepID=UPI003F6527C6